MTRMFIYIFFNIQNIIKNINYKEHLKVIIYYYSLPLLNLFSGIINYIGYIIFVLILV